MCICITKKMCIYITKKSEHALGAESWQGLDGS